MPNPGAERPLRRVTLNLFEEDCVTLERLHGYGWTGVVRDRIHVYIRSLTQYQSLKLGDLDD